MAGVLYRLGRLCASRAVVVVAVWLGLVVVVWLVVWGVGADTSNDLSFILNGDPTIKQFGVGLSVAVLLASAMVLSLAPAMLTLFGGAVWWLPRWLSRLLPHVDIEGEPEPPTPAPAPATVAERRP